MAFNTAEKVIHEGPYRLCPDFRHLFRWSEPGDWYDKESIIVLPEINRSIYGFTAYMLPQYPAGTEDNESENVYAGRVRPSRFAVDNFIRYSGGSKGTAGDHDKIVYSSTEDPRYAATFLDAYVNQKTGEKLYTYPHDSEIPTASDAYLRKFLDPSFDGRIGKAGFYLMRLAEMYLISAESSASLSRTPGDLYWETAINRVNALRSRARHSQDSGEAAGPPDWISSSFASRENLINAIIWERTIELMGEGHEWFDTHRRGAKWLLDNIAKPASDFYLDNEDMSEYVAFHFTWVGDSNEPVYPSSVNELRRSLLLPYPEDAVRGLTSNYQNDFCWW